MEKIRLFDLVSDNFDYRNGRLYWNQDRRGGRGGRGIKAGDRAGNVANGYRQIGINGKNYFEHRLIYALHNPNWDETGEIDHINRLTDDNRIENLRVVTGQENQFNRNARGYCWHKQKQKWMAYIMVDGKLIYLGNFDYKTDARLARVTEEKKYHVIQKRTNNINNSDNV